MNSLIDNVNEMWLPIPEFEEYLISNLGRVFSKKTNRVLKPLKVGDGYLKVDLYKGDGVYPKKVHRLVLEAFCPPADSTLQVNHKNGVKTNNHLDNLEWVTARENILHSIYHLGNAPVRKPKPIGQFSKDGQLITTYRSANEASRATGVNLSNICKCANNRPKYSHAGGYVWKYLEDTNLSKAA